MATIIADISAHDFGLYGKVSDLISAGKKQNPDCDIWVRGQKLWPEPDSNVLPNSDILETAEGIAMMSCKYACSHHLQVVMCCWGFLLIEFHAIQGVRASWRQKITCTMG